MESIRREISWEEIPGFQVKLQIISLNHRITDILEMGQFLNNSILFYLHSMSILFVYTILFV